MSSFSFGDVISEETRGICCWVSISIGSSLLSLQVAGGADGGIGVGGKGEGVGGKGEGVGGTRGGVGGTRGGVGGRGFS